MSQDPVTPVDGIPAGSRRAQRGGPSRGAVVLSLVAAVLAGVIVGGIIAIGTGQDQSPDRSGTAGPTDAPADSAPIEATVSSFDPVAGGSGFRDEGGTWRTQTYTTASFGQLKPGVGLLLDLGDARDVTDVTVETATPGLTVELLAGDDAPSGSVDGMTSTDSTTTGDGATTLSGEGGGAHRYWLVWVTELAQTDGGFSATLSTPVVQGPAS